MPGRRHARLQSFLRDRRAARGMPQADLARAAGVTRQAIHAIESGRYLPNVSLALRLARALGCRVEDLFAAPSAAGGAAVTGRLLGGPAEPPVRAKGWEVAGQLFLLPVSRLGPSLSFALGADAVIVGRPAAGERPPRVRARLLRPRAELARTIAVAGCDPAVHLVGQHLRRQAEAGELVAWSLGSTAALESLERGEVHVAGVHVVDPRTGEANVAFLRRRLRAGTHTVVTFASWEAGLLVRRGNPKRIRGVGDLGRRGLRLVNREAGSGARLLLDARLREHGLGGGRIPGYDDVVGSHLEVGQRVADGVADTGMAVRPIAELLGLGFVPVQTERYDLVIPSRLLVTHPALPAFVDALLSPEVRAEIDALGGYDTRETGHTVDWAKPSGGGRRGPPGR